MVACKPATYAASEYEDLCLAEAKVVSIVRDPLYRECLVLKAKGIKLRLILFVNDLLEHEEAQECKTVLHRNYREIVDTCKDHPVMLPK